jgi:hypothetical protein
MGNLSALPELYACVVLCGLWLVVLLLITCCCPPDDEKSVLPDPNRVQVWSTAFCPSQVRVDSQPYHLQELYVSCSADYSSRFVCAVDKIRLYEDKY